MIAALFWMGYYVIAVIVTALYAKCTNADENTTPPPFFVGALWPLAVLFVVVWLLLFPIHCVAMKFGKRDKDDSEKEEK